MQRITMTLRHITILGLGLLAVSAIAGVSAVSVSASGHEFVASATGKVKSKQTNPQVFKTSAGTIECTHATGTGEIKELKSVTHKEVITYEGCTGFGGGIKISPVHFEFNANGSARVEKQVILYPEGLGCEVILEPQTLESLGYTNNSGGTVTAGATVNKIHSFGTGGMCGGEEETQGTYSGSIKAELEGGTLQWK
jgi:hypothetical protein